MSSSAPSKGESEAAAKDETETKNAAKEGPEAKPSKEKEPRPHGKSLPTDALPLPLITAPRAWSVSAVRGKVTDRCLWSVCKALTAGVFLIAIGAGMATLGYYSDTLSTMVERRGNTTVLIKNESRDSHLNSLTYLGPIVMGIGGFIIVAACVMTFEARDTTAKIVPVWFRKSRIQVQPGSGSNLSGRSSQTSWERFLVKTRRSRCEDSSRTSMTKAFMNFSKYIQSSIDSGKISPGVLRTATEKLRKCPSEPNMNIPTPRAKDHIHPSPETEALIKVDKPRSSLAPPDLIGLRPRLSMAAPHLCRQAMSIDCPRGPVPSRVDGAPSEGPMFEDPIQVAKFTQLSEQDNVNRCGSSGSMSLDLYLPQGAVTLKVKDETKKVGVKGSSPAFQPIKFSPVGRRRSMSQGTKDPSHPPHRALRPGISRTPPQLSRENSSPRTSPQLSRESSSQSPKLSNKQNRDLAKASNRTPRPSRENSGSSFKSATQLSRDHSSPSSPQRSVDHSSPKSKMPPKVSTDTGEFETRILIPQDPELPTSEDVMQEAPKAQLPPVTQPDVDPFPFKKSLKDLESVQSSSMKRHPLMRQKAVDPSQSKDVPRIPD